MHHVSRREFPEGEYRGWRYTVIVVPAPENRWKFVAQFRRGDEPKRDGRLDRTYITWDEAAAHGELFALEWIDREEEEKR
jgi:hypothetical protein